MVRCPRCDQPVDETARTTCPLCFTPLQAQAAPPAAEAAAPDNAAAPPAVPPLPNAMASQETPSPLAPLSGGIPGLPHVAAPVAPPVSGASALSNPNARVSLTGEIIDGGMSDPAAGAPLKPGGYAGGSLGGVAPVRPNSQTGARRPGGERVQPERKASGALPMIAALVLLVVGGYGGWYYKMHRTNPKDQALAVYKSLVAQDWKTLYDLTALSEDAQKKAGTSEEFAKTMSDALDSNPQAKMGLDALKQNLTDIAVSEPKLDGGKADVPTSAKLKLGGRSITFRGVAHMINEGGIWKLDSTSNNLQDGMETGKDLIGKPEGFSGGGLGFGASP